MSMFLIDFRRRLPYGTRSRVAFLVVGLVAAYELAQFIITANMVGLEFLGVFCAACIVTVTILMDWRRGLLILITWLLFEDFARKYLGNNMVIYFAKDILTAVFYLSFFLDRATHKASLFKPPFRVPLLLLIWFGTIQVFNPGSPSIYFGLMGFKLFFYYVPLAWVGYVLATSEKDLRRFLSLNTILLLIIASLGVAQSILGHTFLNPVDLQDDIRELASTYRVSPISGLISYRPTSVFVSTGRYANFLSVGWILVLGSTAYSLFRERKGRTMGFIALIASSAAMVLSASRGVFMWGLINASVFSIAFLLGAPWHTEAVIRVLRTIQRTAIGMAAALVSLFYIFPDALRSRLSFYAETMSLNGSQSELSHRAWEYPLQEFLKAFTFDRWPYGYGIGTQGLGTQYVSRFFHVSPIEAGVESGFGTILVEQGIVGLILWLLMTATVLFSAWRIVSKLRGTIWFPLAFAIFWFGLLLFLPYTAGGIMAYEDFVINAYFWLLLGVLFRLPFLAQLKTSHAQVETQE